MKITIRCLPIFFLLFAFCTNDNNIKTKNLSEDKTANQELQSIIEKIKSTDSADSIDFYFNRANIISEKNGFLNSYSEVLLLKGNKLYEANKYKLALDVYTQALEQARKGNQKLMTGKILERLASLTLSMGDDSKALKLYYEALPLFQKNNNIEGIAKVYNIIGLYNHGQKNYDSAEVYYQKAIQLNTEINNQKGLVHNKGNLGYLYEKMARFDEAEKLYLQMIRQLKTIRDSSNLAIIYYNYSSLFQKQNNIDSTIIYLNKAIVISKQKNDTSLLTALYKDLGEIYLYKNQHKKALELFEQSRIFGNAINDFRNLVPATKFIIQLDTLQKNYPAAIAEYNKLLWLNDSLYKRKLRNNLKVSELKYENQKNENLIQIQNIELKNSRKQNILFFILLISILIISAFLVVIIFLLKNKKKKEVEFHLQKEKINRLKIRKLEEELIVSTREKIISAVVTEQNKKLIDIINKKIEEIIYKKDNLNSEALNEISFTIKSQLSDSNTNDIFNQSFNKLHKNFFSKLKTSHPKLTKSELKFCAYLKLNYNGKQIAVFSNVTSEAIRKTRYRIRKKLNLKKEDSLEDYISKF